MKKYLNRVIVFLCIFLAIIISFIIYMARQQNHTYDFNVYKTIHSPDYRLIEQPVPDSSRSGIIKTNG